MYSKRDTAFSEEHVMTSTMRMNIKIEYDFTQRERGEGCELFQSNNFDTRNTTYQIDQIPFKNDSFGMIRPKKKPMGAGTRSLLFS